MSLLGDIFNGIADGLHNSTSQRQTPSPDGAACERGRIDRLCQELGWSVDEREGNKILLHFKDAECGIRKVRITKGDSEIVCFWAHSHAVIPTHRVPDEIPSFLLRRNLEDCGMGMWGMHVDDDDDDTTFHLYYPALGAGLNAELFQYICRSLCKEASDFDDKLRQAGLLD